MLCVHPRPAAACSSREQAGRCESRGHLEAGGRCSIQQAEPNGGSAASFQVGLCPDGYWDGQPCCCVLFTPLGAPRPSTPLPRPPPGLPLPGPPYPPRPNLPPAWQESRGILWLCLCWMKSTCSGLGPLPSPTRQTSVPSPHQTLNSEHLREIHFYCFFKNIEVKSYILNRLGFPPN